MITYQSFNDDDGVNGVHVSFQSFDNDDNSESFQSNCSFDDSLMDTIGAVLGNSSIKTTFLDDTSIKFDDDEDRADGGYFTMRSVSFQLFDDDGGNINGAFNGNDANSSNNSDDNASGSILSD